MVNIRFLEVVFDTQIQPWEIPAFRGAIANMVGWKNEDFHNHHKNGEVKYAYPKIQYKDQNGFSSMVCIGDTVDQMYLVFTDSKKKISFSGKEHRLDVKELRLNSFDVKLTKYPMRYKIKRWLPLNQHNFKKYDSLDDIDAKTKMLEGILIGNLLSFFKGIHLWVEERIVLDFVKITKIQPLKFKKQKVLAFDGVFDVNVALPDHIGLGKGVSVGFGGVEQIRRNRKNRITKNLNP